MDIKQIVLFILGAPVRHGLTILGAWLTAIGASADSTEAVVSSGFDFVIGLIVIAVGIGLSYLTKFVALKGEPLGK